MNPNILFFDGICHLCNGYINFLSAFKSKKIVYAPLQGQTASRVLTATQIKNLNSLLYYKNGIILEKSSAVIESLVDASPLFFGIKIFYLIPGVARDTLYNLIARNRYRLFGQADTCRRPTAEEKKFILD